MLTNYLKIAWRNLIKNKFSTFINIGGLAVGMTVAIIIGLWSVDELSFNKYFQNYDRIGQVLIKHIEMGQWDVNRTMSIPIGNDLRSNYDDEFKYVVMSTSTQEYIISTADHSYSQKGRYMQSEAPEMFTLKMIRGSRSGLSDQHSILLSESFAKTLFADADPIGKILKVDSKSDVKVTGVYQNLPENTQFNDVQFILPWDLLISSVNWYKRRAVDWNDNFLFIYVELKPQAAFDKVTAKIKNEKIDHLTKELAKDKPEVFLQPMSKWHLYSKFENGVSVTSQPLQLVKLCVIIGVFVLLLACINFMNLNTARSEKRAKEVGIRKTMGSLRLQLIGQFYWESLLTTIFAFAFSLLLVMILLPWFNGVAGKNISTLWNIPLFWILCLGFTFITGIIAGSYPAIYLSSFNPVKVLKGTFRVGRLASLPRKVLVVFQFTVSVILIIGTTVVYRQIQFSKNRPIGYNNNGLIEINMKTDDIHRHHDGFHADLLKTGAVQEMAESDGSINELWSNNLGFNWKGKDPGVPDKIYIGTIGVSDEFGKTVGWEFMQGRDFSRGYTSDSNAFVVNESFVKYTGLKDPIGENIEYNGKNYEVIGVIKDVLMESPYDPVSPTVFFLGTWYHGTLSIKINPTMGAHEALKKIETVFKKYAPSMPFDYQFADSEYAKKFAAEDRIGHLAGFFSGLAILISCLGLFGLASFVAEQRTKEIGIRKLLGASVASLWQMLSKEFVLLVLISCLIAIPVADYFLNAWISQYAYHTKLSWWIFVLAVVAAFIITLLTISYQSIKAALMNPVNSLGKEL